jgi:hypothetical protein
MKPTKEMISAGEDAILNTCGDEITDPDRAAENATRIFNAMMAAAPEADEQRPDAWRYRKLTGGYGLQFFKPEHRGAEDVRPLYLHPEPVPVVVIPSIWNHYSGAKVANIYEQAMNGAGVKWRSVDDKVNGWIDWHGGMFRPVRSDAIIDVMFANGNVKPNICAGSVVFEWQKTPKDNQRVTAYRLHTYKG